ncbi:MAG TPA: hypothetical protein VF190_16345, partial [Rhodothermales bacterium]
MSVTPDGAATPPRHPNTGGYVQTFTVTNDGPALTFTLGCFGRSNVTCTAVDSASVTLGPGASTGVVASYNVGALGTGSLVLKATNGQTSDSGYMSVPVAYVGPTVSTAPHNAAYQDLAKCVASCFDMVFTHSTPAYFSLSTPRSFTLVYNSRTVRPTPVIFLDLTNQPGPPYPTSYSVQARKTGGANLTLLNGTQTVYYTPGTTQTARIAVAFDAITNAMATGFHDVDVTVTAQYSGATAATTVTTRVLVIDQTASPYGAGFDIGGVQRIVFKTGSYSVLVTEGDGSAAFYQRDCGTCAFVTPAGTALSLSAVGSLYRRTGLDGSFVEFNTDGTMARAVDRFGNQTTLTWSAGKLVRIQDPMGKRDTITYNGSSKLATVVDPAARTTTYTVNASNLLVKIVDPDSRFDSLMYNGNKQITTMFDRARNPWDYTYDALNRVDSVRAPQIKVYGDTLVRPATKFTAPERVVWQ